MNLIAKRVIIILALALCVALGAFAASRIFKPAPAVSNLPNIVQAKRDEFESIMQTISARDKDLDGLSNDDEVNIYHTNPNSADTDKDGLNDGDEIKIYKTDPLKYDTYGIGHSDGWGVMHGIILPEGKRAKN